MRTVDSAAVLQAAHAPHEQRSAIGGHLQVAEDCALDALEALPLHVTFVGAGNEGEPLFTRLAPRVRAFDARFVAGAVLGLAVCIGAAVGRTS